MDTVGDPAASLEKSETLLHRFADKIVDFLENVRMPIIKSLQIEKKQNFKFRPTLPKAFGSATAKSRLIVVLDNALAVRPFILAAVL